MIEPLYGQSCAAFSWALTLLVAPAVTAKAATAASICIDFVPPLVRMLGLLFLLVSK
jgi:hypothetical protein